MPVKRTGVLRAMPRWAALTTGILALAVMTIATGAAKERPRRLPKGVEVVRLSDGSHDVSAKVTASLPTGEQVQQVSPGDRLEEVARILCPQGHDMTMGEGTKIRIVSGRLVATQTANVRCANAIDAPAATTAETP